MSEDRGAGPETEGGALGGELGATGDDIRLERRGNIAIVTFHRPEVLNAFNTATYRRLLDVLEELATEESVRVVILTGAGRAFCAGTDLRELGEDGALTDEASFESARRGVERNQEITRRLVTLDQVTIAAVNGYAVGFGAELAIACDIRVAAETAWFVFPEVERALFVTNGVTWMLPRIVGLGRAIEWLTTGRRISAAEALGAGLVTEYVTRDRLLELALDIGGVIAGNAPLSVRMTKRALQDRPASLEDALAAETRALLACRRAEDWEEGVLSFLEKRRPIYRGR